MPKIPNFAIFQAIEGSRICYPGVYPGLALEQSFPRFSISCFPHFPTSYFPSLGRCLECNFPHLCSLKWVKVGPAISLFSSLKMTRVVINSRISRTGFNECIFSFCLFSYISVYPHRVLSLVCCFS